jgi:transposase InsO family protein
MDVSELRACQVIGQHRSTQRKRPKGRPDGDALTAAIIRLAEQYGRYGYRRITRLLRAEGWHVNAKRVQRIWRREGLKVPQKQPKRGRLTHDNTPSFYQRLKCCVDQLRPPIKTDNCHSLGIAKPVRHESPPNTSSQSHI